VDGYRPKADASNAVGREPCSLLEASNEPLPSWAAAAFCTGWGGATQHGEPQRPVTPTHRDAPLCVHRKRVALFSVVPVLCTCKNLFRLPYPVCADMAHMCPSSSASACAIDHDERCPKGPLSYCPPLACVPSSRTPKGTRPPWLSAVTRLRARSPPRVRRRRQRHHLRPHPSLHRLRLGALRGGGAAAAAGAGHAWVG